MESGHRKSFKGIKKRITAEDIDDQFDLADYQRLCETLRISALFALFAVHCS